MMIETSELIISVVTAAVTGGVSTFATVRSLNVHIDYLRSQLRDQRSAIQRAHERIDDINDRLNTRRNSEL